MTWTKSTKCESAACVEVDVAWTKSTKCATNACVEVDVAWTKSTKCDTGTCVEVDMEFRKSSYSGSQGGNCVEVGAQWHKSSFSGNNGSCVECTCDTTDDTIAVRDSKDPDGGILEFSHGSWNNFLAAVKAGDFDLPA